MPVLTTDITIGTSKVEKLNLSHNAISDIRKGILEKLSNELKCKLFNFLGVIGNLTMLKSLDLSYNKLHDLNSEVDFFQLPENISEIYLTKNVLSNLPWKNVRNATQLKLLDIRDNHFEEFGQELTEMVKRNVDVYFEGEI